MTSPQGAFTRVEPHDGSSRFRLEFYDALAARADGLFELVDAMLCADGAVKSLVERSLVPEHRRGHGSLYDAINNRSIDSGRVRVALGALPVPRAADGRIVLAVDASNWLRPDAATSPERLFCHVYGRGRSADQFIPGRPYSFVAALEAGLTSWTGQLDAVRLGPADDATNPKAGRSPRTSRPRRPIDTAPPRRGHGTDCTRDWPTAPAGSSTTARFQSSRARSYGSTSSTCPENTTRSRSGCGHR